MKAESDQTIEDPDVYEPPSRLPTIEQAREYIFGLSFEALKGVMEDEAKGGIGWPRGKLDYVEGQYKNWLYLRRKYETLTLPPTDDVDKLWHYHMLDSRAYLRDTMTIFGCYLHHFPYFGIRGERDRKELIEAFEKMQQLHLLEFGEEAYDWDDEDEDQDEVQP